MKSEITTTEKGELQQLERVIESGLKTFVDVGLALVKIRDGKLYLQDKHTSFESYCKERWNMSRPRAYQLIDAAGATENLSTTVDKPETERVARPLTRLPPEKQAEAWEAANEKANGEGRKVAARDVEEVVVEMVETKEVKKGEKPKHGSYEDWRTLKNIIADALSLCAGIASLKVDVAHKIQARDLCQSVSDRFSKLAQKITE